MQIWKNIFFTLLILIIVSGLHIGLTFILPYPWSKLNLLFIFFILYLVRYSAGRVIWLVFFSHLFIELFATSPFGIILFSSVITFLLAFWLYQSFFTNQSWYAVLGLSFFVTICYRLFYFILLIFINWLGLISSLPWKLIFITWWWEILFTNLGVMFFYFLLNRFFKKHSTLTLGHKYG